MIANIRAYAIRARGVKQKQRIIEGETAALRITCACGIDAFRVGRRGILPWAGFAVVLEKRGKCRCVRRAPKRWLRMNCAGGADLCGILAVRDAISRCNCARFLWKMRHVRYTESV